MSEREDYRLRDPQPGDELELGERYEPGRTTSGEPSPPRRGGAWIWIVLLLVIAGAGIAWWLLGRGAGDGVEPPPSMAEEPRREVSAPPAEEPAEDVALPPLDASDTVVAQLVGALSERPELAQYLATDALVRRFTAAVDNVSRGNSPRANLPSLIPPGKYQAVDVEEGVLHPDPESYRRYDAATAVLVSLDTDGAARLYRRLRPLLEESYRELGYPEGGFDATLAQAIDHLLEAPVPPPEPELVPAARGGGYAYADPELESLSTAQKHLLRAGPENVRRIQAKLRELRRGLDLAGG